MIARENTTFEAVIGPAANPRGYTGITGMIIKEVKLLMYCIVGKFGGD